MSRWIQLNLPGSNGLDLPQESAKADIQIPITFITGHGDVPTSVRAMKAGAVEFLTKPCRAQDLLQAVERSLERDQRLEVASLRQRYDTRSARARTVKALVVSGLLGCVGQSAGTSCFMPQQAALRSDDGR